MALRSTSVCIERDKQSSFPPGLTLCSYPHVLLLLRWMVTSWSACTRSCGGGVQTRRVTCQKLKASGISTPVSNDMCTQLAKRPVDTQACNQELCVEWAFSSWGQVRGQRASAWLFWVLVLRANLQILQTFATAGREMSSSSLVPTSHYPHPASILHPLA